MKFQRAEKDPSIAEFLESIYSSCNIPARLERDPLAVVKSYPRVEDREIAGLVCSTLAFGSVDLILRACEAALSPLGDSPAAALDAMSEKDIGSAWGGFQYRFCFPKDSVALFRAIKAARTWYGSLQGLFLAGCGQVKTGDEGPLVEETSRFVRGLRRGAEGSCSAGIRANLLPDPADGSACKRIFLFLRWMVRRDAVDPGGWDEVSPARLVVPLDVHMFRTCRDRLGFFESGAQSSPRARSSRGARSSPGARGPAAPNLAAALRATAMFKLYSPLDPVKYDFALTRPGIDPRPGDEVFACL